MIDDSGTYAFSEYVTSNAFLLSLSKTQLSFFARMVKAGEKGIEELSCEWGGSYRSFAALERRGLAFSEKTDKKAFVLYKVTKVGWLLVPVLQISHPDLFAS